MTSENLCSIVVAVVVLRARSLFEILGIQLAAGCRGWQRGRRCLIFIGLFLQKSPIISGSLMERDLPVTACYGSPPFCGRHSLVHLECRFFIHMGSHSYGITFIWDHIHMGSHSYQRTAYCIWSVVSSISNFNQ